MYPQKYRILAILFLIFSFNIYLGNRNIVLGEKKLLNNSLQTSTSGTEDWYRTWGGPGDDYCTDIIVDDSGNIYIAGITDPFDNGSNDMFLIKYNSSGSLLFNKTWGTIHYDVCYAMDSDSSGNIYLAGMTEVGGVNNEMCLVKYDSNGNYVWNKTWGDTGYESCLDIVIDDSDEIYLAGETNSFGAGGNDMCLVKFDDMGNYIWNKTWGASSSDRCFAFGINIYDEICMAGNTRSYGDMVHGDIALVKYRWSGDYDWHEIWAGNDTDTCESLITDALGNFILGGSTYSYGSGESDALVIKYGRSGDQMWNFTWGTPGWEACTDITLDSSDDMYITGYTASNVGYAEIFVMKIGYIGEPLWFYTWGLEYHDFATAIALDSLNNIYVGGQIEVNLGVDSDVLIIKNPKSVATEAIAGYDIVLLNGIILMSLAIILLRRYVFKKRFDKEQYNFTL
ncbi:MAG: SBBP repeat-containing protein [Candidatus Thorarchaeota archaeon]